MVFSIPTRFRKKLTFFSGGEKNQAKPTTPTEKPHVLLGDCNRSFANTSSLFVLIPKYDTHRHKFRAKLKKKKY